MPSNQQVSDVIRRARTIASTAVGGSHNDRLTEIAFREILAANRHLLTFTPIAETQTGDRHA
jgi:DNA-directed RNA polymerase subunit K/omega